MGNNYNDPSEAPMQIKNGLDVRQLMSSGIVLEFGGEREDMITDADFDVLDEDDVKDNEESYQVNPAKDKFEEAKKRMVQVELDRVYKTIVKAGTQQIPENVEVTAHYNAYFEGETYPFDSTYNHPKPFRHVFGGDILPGLETALRSMKLGEESQFIISWKVLYGELGAPPRVPPRADALFVIRLLSFKKTQNFLSEEQQNSETDFARRFRQATLHYQDAKDCFSKHRYYDAISNFNRALAELERATVSNESEESAQQNFMYRLWRNLAISYNKNSNYKKACLIINNNLNGMTSSTLETTLYKDPKALYQLGIAQMNLNSDLAEKTLQKALKLAPSDPLIQQALRTQQEKAKIYRDQEKAFLQKAFALRAEALNSKDQNVQSGTNDPKGIKDILVNFKNSKVESITLKGTTKQEVDNIKKYEEELGLKLCEIHLPNDSIEYQLHKLNLNKK